MHTLSLFFFFNIFPSFFLPQKNATLKEFWPYQYQEMELRSLKIYLTLVLQRNLTENHIMSLDVSAQAQKNLQILKPTSEHL